MDAVINDGRIVNEVAVMSNLVNDCPYYDILYCETHDCCECDMREEDNNDDT